MAYPNIFAGQSGPLALSSLDANFNFATDIQSQAITANAGGTADAITATFNPAVTSLINGLTLFVRASAANATTTPQFSPNGLTARTIVKASGALAVGDIYGSGHWLQLTYDSTLVAWVLTNPASTLGGALTATSINTGQIAGTRNRIINGAMAIDQRNAGASQTFTAAAALAYSVDRWYGYCTGANVTGQRVSGTAPSQYDYQFTGAASVTKIGFAQRIEAANCQDLAGQTATLSVFLSNSVLTTVTWTAWYANTADTFGTLASPTRTLIATGTFTVNSTFTRYSTSISISASATTGIEVEFSVGAQTSGTWKIGRTQLELGSTATTFEQRSYGLELALCQRYYWRKNAESTAEILTAGTNRTGATTSYQAAISFPVVMRVLPTSQSISAVGHFSIIANDTVATCTNFVVGGVSKTSIWFTPTYPATGSLGQAALVYFKPT